MVDPYAHTPEPVGSSRGKHDRHDCPIYREKITPCKDCLPNPISVKDPEPPAEPMCKDPTPEASKTTRRIMKMPEPTGEMANVPPGWPPQTWGAHLANLAWMKEMGRGHYSFTSPARHVKRYTQKILEEDRLRILKILREEGLTYRNAQHDVHLRDLDGVKSLIQRVAAQRAEAEGAATPTNAAGPQQPKA